MPFCLEEACARPGRTPRQISVIPVDSIHPCAWSRAYLGDIGALADSIRRLGLLAPLVVRAVRGGYEVIAGVRRLEACRLLHMASVECVVVAPLEEDCLLMALGENMCREPLTECDAEPVRRLLEFHHDYTPRELAALCGEGRAGQRNGNSAPEEAPEPPVSGAHASTQAAPMSVITDICEPAAPCDDSTAAGGADALPRCEDRHGYAHGYIRDERLVINAVENVVSEMRGAGVDAQLDVGGDEQLIRLEISFPRVGGARATGDGAPPQGEEPVPSESGSELNKQCASQACEPAADDSAYMPRSHNQRARHAGLHVSGGLHMPGGGEYVLRRKKPGHTACENAGCAVEAAADCHASAGNGGEAVPESPCRTAAEMYVDELFRSEMERMGKSAPEITRKSNSHITRS